MKFLRIPTAFRQLSQLSQLNLQDSNGHLSLSLSMGASRSVACRNAGTQSGTPLRQDLAASSPQCDIKRPVSNGSDHIASWITEPDLFWKTGEARGGPDTQLPAMRYKTPQEQWDRSYCILDYRARHAGSPETYNKENTSTNTNIQNTGRSLCDSNHIRYPGSACAWAASKA